MFSVQNIMNSVMFLLLPASRLLTSTHSFMKLSWEYYLFESLW